MNQQTENEIKGLAKEKARHKLHGFGNPRFGKKPCRYCKQEGRK